MKHFCSFSEAIREGAKLRPQASGGLMNASSSCAVGAGLEAMGHLKEPPDCTRSELAAYHVAEVAYPYLENREACPAACSDYRDTLTNVLWHLNDHHHWTREAIADWLESEDPKKKN